MLSAAGEALGQVPYALAEQVPQLASMGAGARLGSRVGSFFGPVGTAAGTGLGALAGQFLSSYVPTAGANLEAQARAQIAEGKPVDVNPLAAYGAAIPGAALDVFTDRLLLGKGVVGRLMGFTDEQVAKKSAQELEKLASEKLLPKLTRGEISAGTLAKGTAKGTVEVPIEITQQMLERAQAGLPLTSDEALAEYGSAAYQAGLLSPLGGVGRISERGGARAEIAERKKQAADAALAAQEAEATKPENLLKLFDDYTAAKEEASRLSAAIPAAPSKKKKPQDYAKWEEDTAGAREAASDHMENILRPLRDAYRQREDLIKPLVAQRQAAQAAAQPAAAPTIVPPTVTQLMDEYDALNQQRDEIGAKIQAAAATGDPAVIDPLHDQWTALTKYVDQVGKALEGAGGTTETAPALDKQIAKLNEQVAKIQAGIVKAAEVGDFDAVRKQTGAKAALLKDLSAVQEKRALVEGRPSRTAVAEQPEVTAPAAEELAPKEEAPPPSITPYNFPTPYEMFGAKSVADLTAPFDLPTPMEMFGDVDLDRATKFVRDTGKANITHLEQGLNVKRQVAAQLLMDLEKAGVVTPLKGNKREVIKETTTTPAAEAPKVETKTTETPPAGPVQHAIEGVPVVKAPVNELKLSQDVPQFKAEANAEGVVKPLKGTFADYGVAPIQLWRRLDGSLEIISGRHRWDLAKRSGRQTIDAQIFDEAAGFDRKKAATMDAEINIRDGQGTVADYVNYFQGAQLSKEEADARGLTRGKGEEAIEIATNGSPELIAAHRAKQISDDLAATAAAEAPKDSRIQAVAIKAAQSKSAAEALNLMRAVQVIAPKPAEGGMADMFGFDESAMLEAQEMAKIATQKQREVGQRLSAITGASKNPKLAAAEGIDIKDPEAVKRRIAELQQLKAAWNNWTTNPTLVGEIRAAMKPAEAAGAPQGRTETKAETPAEGTLAQDEQDAMFRAKGEQATAGMPTAEIEDLIKPFRQLPVAPKITVVQSISELPEKIQAQMERDGTQGAPGMYHPPTETIYLVGDNLIDGADVGKTISHEMVGHFGLRGVLGNSYPAVMRSIYQNNKQIKAEANARMQDNPEMSLEVATEESIAERAEKDVSLTWMNRLVNLIRTKLRQWGIWKGAPIGDSEIIRLIRDSHKYVHGVTTKPSETVKALAKVAPEGRSTAPTGEALYRSRKPTKSVVAQRTSAADDLMSLYTGLTGASSRDATMAGIKDKTNTKALKLRQRIFDQYAPLVAAVMKGVDAKVIDALRAQNLMYFMRFGQQRSDIVGQTVTSGPPRLRSEKTNAGTEYFYENDAGGPTLVGMAQALEKAKGYKEEDRENAFTVYLAGKRAEQVGWNKLRFDNPVEAENEYKAVLAHLKQNPADKAAFEAAEKIYQNYNAGLLDFLVQTGAMSKQKAAELKSITYVPFYRVDKDGNIRMETGDERRAIRIGNIKDEPRLKELLGDSEQILPVFTSAVQNTSMLINMAMRNQTVKDTAFVLKDLGIASRIVASKGAYADNVVHFRVHGVEHHAIIDTDMYGIPAQMIVEGLEGIKLAMPAIVRMLGVPGDIFRKFTVRNPLYMFRQLVRDPVSAWVQTGTSTVPILDSFSTLAKMATGKDTTAQRLQRAGATSSNVLVGDARDMTKFLEDLTAGKWSLQRAFSKLDTVAQQSDAATRQVIYEDSIKKGMSHQQALMRTLESMNFSRRGTSPSMYLLASLTPFMHSQVQGLDVLYRSMRGQLPGADKLTTMQQFTARAAMLAVSSLAYAAVMQDDEDYKRAKPEERYGNWWVPTLGLTKENWIKIPIPYEVGFLFKALPEAMVNTAFGDEKAKPALSALWRTLGQSVPLDIPQALKPALEVRLGSSLFSGDIESPHEKEILPQYRYRTNSTELAKMLGGVAGLSPIQIDYLIRGYTGGVGMAITQMANVFLRAPEAENVARPTTKLSEVPLIGALFQTTEGRGALDATYKLIEEIQQYKGAYNKLIQDGKPEEAMQFANENASVLAASSMAGYMKKTLGEMSKQARMIKASPQMTTEQKDAALENLYISQLAMSRNFLKNAERTTLR